MINDLQRRDLSDLRQHAQARNHEQIQFVLKRLLQQMPFFYSLAVVLETVYRFLDVFESYYPDEGWVRQMLLSIASFGTAPDDSVAEMALAQAFTEAGTGNYIKAIYDITQAMQSKHTPEARVGYLTSALVNAVMAELAEAWYGDKPDLWQTVRQDPTAPDSMTIAYAFWTNPQTAALDTQNWLEIADALERALERL
jgi:hypothetical protein